MWLKHSVGMCLAFVLSGSLLAAPSLDSSLSQSVKRGQYLSTLGDCAACHSMQGGKQFHGSQGFNLNNNNMNNQPFGNNANVNASPFVATDTNNNFSNNNNQSFFNANPAMNESKQSNFFSSPNNNFKKPFINKNFILTRIFS